MPTHRKAAQSEELEKLDQLLHHPTGCCSSGDQRLETLSLMRDRRAGIPVLRMPGHTTRIPAAKLQLWIEKHTSW